MSETTQLFSVSLAKDAVYRPGLRSFMEYRDLGIEKATHGMFYVLKDWITFIYEGKGEHTFREGDCVLQPAGIVHNELDCSDDVEVLEIYSPAVHQAVVVEGMTAAAH